MSMFDLKALNAALVQLQEERGIPKEQIIEAIEASLATAYKKEFGQRGQNVRCFFDLNSGDTKFELIKTVVDEDSVRMPVAKSDDDSDDKKDKSKKDDKDEKKAEGVDEDDDRPFFNPEQHIMLENALLIEKDAVVGKEIIFPLEHKDDFGRIAAQTAKQVIIQKIREAEKESVMREYGEREGEVITGTVQRVDRGNIFIDMGRAVGILPRDEQIPGERFEQGERIQAYLYSVDEGGKGAFLRLSRSHPQFVIELFKRETPEVEDGTVVIKSVAREPGSRSKIAVHSTDSHIDPIGALVGQRGVRVSTVQAELGQEKIDIIEWSENPAEFIEEAISPAQALDIELDEENLTAFIKVDEEQQSLAIGRGGQNVRLAAKLTGWKINIQAVENTYHEDEDEDGDLADDGEDDGFQDLSELKAEAEDIKGSEEDVVEEVEDTEDTAEESTEDAEKAA